MTTTPTHSACAATREAAELICRYLARNPSASDTVDGVARWWLSRQRQHDAVVTVEQALHWLQAQGVVTTSVLPTGATLYRLAERVLGAQPDEMERE